MVERRRSILRGVGDFDLDLAFALSVLAAVLSSGKLKRTILRGVERRGLAPSSVKQ